MDQYTIPSGSMEPTLRGDPRFFRGDRVLVNKWQFGPRIPFTTHRLWKWGGPNRWDIVVFRSIDPEAKHPILVKRVVGLPGEKVHIADGKIWINDKQVEPPGQLRDILHYTDQLSLKNIEIQRHFLRFAKKNEPIPVLNPSHSPVQNLYAEMERLHDRVVACDVDTLSDEDVEALCKDVDNTALNVIKNLYFFAQPEMLYGINSAPQFSEIPDGHYFLLGDNSNDSLDGRMYGWVAHNHLYGRVFAVWWPLTRRQDFSGFSYTWWGKALLYGIPALFVVLEITLARRQKHRRH